MLARPIRRISNDSRSPALPGSSVFTWPQHLLARGEQVVGLDNLNAYYDPTLKRARLAKLEGRKGFSFHRLDIADRKAAEPVLRQAQPAI